MCIFALFYIHTYMYVGLLLSTFQSIYRTHHVLDVHPSYCMESPITNPSNEVGGTMK